MKPLNIKIKPYKIDGETIVKVTTKNHTQWLKIQYDSASNDWFVKNINTDSEHYVITNQNGKPTECDCEQRFYNKEPCKHMLAIGKYLNTDNIKTINSKPHPSY